MPTAFLGGGNMENSLYSSGVCYIGQIVINSCGYSLPDTVASYINTATINILKKLFIIYWILLFCSSGKKVKQISRQTPFPRRRLTRNSAPPHNRYVYHHLPLTPPVWRGKKWLGYIAAIARSLSYFRFVVHKTKYGSG